ncbi:MAG TPA: hypothetical protein VGP82_20075 [Ktedonobacterales bacterium]|jgi:hypothetical protein|nr:hypothetical protein [Ktedonobacterales bacterium]
MQEEPSGLERARPWIIVGGIVATILIIAFVVVATIFGWWPVVVDIVLVFTALVSLIMLAALTFAVIYFVRTIVEMRAEIIPVLESLKATTETVQATAEATKTFGVGPSVRAASFVVGAGEIASVILGRGRARKRSEKRQRRRQEIEHELAARGELDGHR